MNLEQARANMVEQQIRTWEVLDQEVIDLLYAVPREQFVPPKHRALAFSDLELPLQTGKTGGQRMWQPKLEARVLQELGVRKSDRVLEIGTGSGYQTAVLARLAGEVYSVERVKPLLDAAFERVLGLGARNVHFRHGDGTLGWPEAAPFDRILITAGAPELPRHLLLGQLKDDGIAVLPIGPQDDQMLVEARRKGSDLKVTDVCPCRFVKLIGQEGWAKD